MQNDTGFHSIFWLIPVLILGYIGWMNLMPLGGTVTHFLDVGGEDIDGQAKITGPFDRISGKKEIDGISFRELPKSPVYFELDDRKLNSAAEISVSGRFRGDFPENARLTLGAKNAEEWSYRWKDIYAPFLQKLETLPLLAKDDFIAVYATGQVNSAGIQNVGEFLQNPPSGSVIATIDKSLNINQGIGEEHLAGIDLNKITTNDASSNYVDRGADGSLRIKNALRGGHTLWTHVTNGRLTLEVTKQDLNWYEGPDILTIEVYSVDGESQGKIEIPDDGDESKSSKMGQPQDDATYMSGLEPGVYRIELKSDEDVLISEIAINQSKLVVAGRMFPVGMNRAYFKDGANFEPLKLYGKYPVTGGVRFRTSHRAGLQRITVSGDLRAEFDISETNTDFRMSLKPGDYEFDVPAQDVIIVTKGYFSFTPESFFLPQRSTVVNLEYDMTWLKENVDYVVIDRRNYVPSAVDTGGWLVGQTSWKTRGLYITNDRLSFSLNVPHLEAQPDRAIAIDWIEITLKIPPIWERLR
ncbi:MAG: hypothetical protein Q8O55_05865 [Dehalococcoidales bacterium]|nr:hypothetical protein [Dehalococcoidales bacterium]